MSLALAATAASITAWVTAATVSGAVAWAGPVDRPRDRGAHQSPTPTAGGLGVIAGTCVGLWLFAAMAGAATESGKIAAALGFASALGLLGGLDDLYDLDARLKFLVQIALALLFAVLVARIEAIPITSTLTLSLGPVIGALGTALWILVVVNAINFMDGANGLASGAGATVLLALAASGFLGGSPAVGAAALAAALSGLGFLPWNFPNARLFQGDAGALFTGFFLAALAVIGAGQEGHGPTFVLFAPLALLPFLTDVLLTLLMRARARKRLFDAHKEHLYQRWLLRRGGSHRALTLRIYLIMAVFAGAALALRTAGPLLQFGGFAAATLAAAAGWLALSRSLAKGQGVRPPG